MQLKSGADMKLKLKWLAVAVLLALTPMNAAAQRSETDLMLSEYWAGIARELMGKGLRAEAIAVALKGIPEGTTDAEMHQFQPAHDALYDAIRSNNFALPIGDRTMHGSVLSPDRSRAVTLSTSPSAPAREKWELWDVEKGEVLAIVRESAQNIDFEMSLFSHDSRYFFSKADNANFQVHDARDGRLIGVRPLSDRAPQSQTSMMLNASMNPSGTRLVTVTWEEGEIRVWSLPDLELLMSNTEFSASSVISKDFNGLYAQFVNDSTLCVMVRSEPGRPLGESKEMTAGLMDGLSGAFSPFYHSTEHIRTGIGIPHRTIDCSPDGKWAIIRFGNDKGLPAFEVVEIESGSIVFRKDNFDQSGIAFHPVEPQVAVVQMEGVAYLDLETQEISRDHPFAPAHYKPYFPLMYDSRTGQSAGGGDMMNYTAIGARSVWDDVPVGGALVDMAFELLPAELKATVEAERTEGEDWLQQTIVLSEVWAQRSKALLDQGRRHDAIVAALKGIPEGADDEDVTSRFAKAHLALYTAYRSHDTHLPMELFDGDSEVIYYVTPDRSRAVTTSYDDKGWLRLDLWRLTQQDKTPIRLDYPPPAIPRQYTNLIVSNDSKWAAASAPDGTVQIYDLHEGRRAAILTVAPRPPEGEQLMPFELGFSPDGKLFTATATISPPQPAIVTRIWTVGDFTEVLSEEAAGPRAGKSGTVQFIDDTTICRRHPQDPLGARKLRFQLLSVDGGKREIDLTGVIDAWDSASSYTCSPDLKWFVVGGFDGRLRHVLINAEARKVVHEFTPGGWSADVFNMDSSQLAVHSEQGLGVFRFLDLGTLEWLPGHPGAPESFSMTLPYAYSERTTRHPTFDIHLYSAYAGHLLWENIPTGFALVQAALDTLSPESRSVVDAERLR